jgi:hypothetical protein
MKRSLTLLLLILLVFSVSTAQTIDKKQYHATRITQAPVINGVLDDEVWKAGEWVDDFTQYEPYNGKKTSQKTEFKILFDENNIYVAFKAYDTAPDSIVNRLTRRDNVDGDLVGVIFDSFHDLRTGFLFGISSSGVKYDQMFTGDGQNQDGSWNPNWWAKTSINGEGWIAEMKIPFSQVRFDKNSSGTWGLEVARIFYRKNETDFWQHVSKDAPGLVHLFGELTGMDNIKPRKIFDVTPYGVAKAETFKKEPGNPFMDKGKKYGLNGGVDAKIGITNNMTMDLTVNPDFGQVEADPSEVNLSAYETFFSEKRPFFIEGNNITNFNMGIGDGNNGNDNLFYSRRIGRRPVGDPTLKDGWHADVPTYTNILGAAKITGKTSKGLSIGFIEALTGEEDAEIDTTSGKVPPTPNSRIFQTVEPLTNYFLGRVQRDFKEGNTILGAIFTSTNRDLGGMFSSSGMTPDDSLLASFMHKSAYTGGFDFTQYFKKKSWMFNLNAAFSQVNGTKEAIALTQQSSARYFQRPDNEYVNYDLNRTSLFGSGGRMQVQKLNGHLNVLGCIIWKTPGFEINDLGYMQQADNVLSVLWAGYHQWEPKGIYRNYNISGDLYFVNDFGGNITGKGIEFNPNITFKNYWQFWGYANLNSPSLSTNMLRGGPMMKMPGSTQVNAGISTDSRKKLNISVNMNSNTGFEKNNHSFYIGSDITYKPINFLFFTFSPAFNKSYSNLQYVMPLNYNGSERYIFASIDRQTISASFRLNFNLTPDLTLQYWGQPYIASGKYYNHKYILDPMAKEYADRFHVYTDAQKSFDTDNNIYNIDENLDGNTDYTIGNNNFNYQFFLSNLVIRWEYSPGSTVYLVWSQTRDNYNSSGQMDFTNNMGDLFNRNNDIPHNIFLIKFSYRFGIK